ncbi:TATA box-binding protein-like protein 1 [Galendromus occidentalis]|uniref:TATA box-binding protein-like 1 n=1 Tax=Galendromus occidentalis TaxID=34638 RepID=A0AAJ6VW24_9ACAR|nr:TATA box-binding protein-like protein 1 [Galendromus occidentalis]
MAGLVHNTLVNGGGQGGHGVVGQRPVILPPSTLPSLDSEDKEECVEEDNNGSPPDELDIVINNVVCSFSVGCHLNLRQIALTGANVVFRRESGMVSMKLRNPYTTASIWSSGKITCTGATSENTSKIAARRFARTLQKLGFKARFKNFKVVNVLGTCTMPFAIRLVPFSQTNKPIAQYEPELHPGVTYKIKEIRASLKIFSTGSITVTAPSVSAVQQSIERIFPLVYEHRKERTCPEDMPRAHNAARKEKLAAIRNQVPYGISIDEDDALEVEEHYYDSDQSWG